MLQYVIKVALTAVIVVAVAELAKRSSCSAAAIASLPLVAACFRLDLLRHGRYSTHRFDVGQHRLVRAGVFAAVLAASRVAASGLGFWTILAVACGIVSMAYVGIVWLLGRLGEQ